MPPSACHATAAAAAADASNSSSMDWDPPPSAKQIQLVGPMSSSQTSTFVPSSSGGGVGVGVGGFRAGVVSGGVLARRGSGGPFVDRIGITRMPDRAWTITLDYLDLGEVGWCGSYIYIYTYIYAMYVCTYMLDGLCVRLAWHTSQLRLFFFLRYCWCTARGRHCSRTRS